MSFPLPRPTALQSSSGDGSRCQMRRSKRRQCHLPPLRHKVEFPWARSGRARALCGDDHRRRVGQPSSTSESQGRAARPDDPLDDTQRHPTERELMASVVFDMEQLAGLDGAGAVAALTPLADAYDHWLDRQAGRIGEFEDSRVDAAAAALERANDIAKRLRAGIELLGADPVAAEAFAFANHTMWQQRLHTIVAAERRDDPKLSLADAEAQVSAKPDWSWRPFQLAFVLVNLPALNDPTHEERQLDTGTADLLFFPTGGGKTEAYLALTAFTLAIRRLQGEVGGHSGEGGVGVLMRYTLRLLTSQQFQRAATLICACEVRRRELLDSGDTRWGETPFRIGMWVGGTVSPNRTKDAARDLDDLRDTGWSKGAGPTALVACPWCGEELDPARDAIAHPSLWRTLITCGDSKGRCPFTARRSRSEGIPVVSVDEEIYRLLPDLVIATADKFAQLPWQGPTSALFGRVYRRCSRHGFRSADLDSYGQHDEADRHPKSGDLPAATTTDCLPRRPPDLIIQDELHLISGPWLPFGLTDRHREISRGPSRRCAQIVALLRHRGPRIRLQLVFRAASSRRVFDAGASFFGVERLRHDSRPCVPRCLRCRPAIQVNIDPRLHHGVGCCPGPL